MNNSNLALRVRTASDIKEGKKLTKHDLAYELSAHSKYLHVIDCIEIYKRAELVSLFNRVFDTSIQ
jgi:hypothetical protein